MLNEGDFYFDVHIVLCMSQFQLLKNSSFGEWEIGRCGARPVGHLTVFFARTAGHLTKYFQKKSNALGFAGGVQTLWGYPWGFWAGVSLSTTTTPAKISNKNLAYW